MKKTRRKNNSFQKIISDNYKTVQKWPKWKQSIVISSYAASTGKFIEEKK